MAEIDYEATAPDFTTAEHAAARAALKAQIPTITDAIAAASLKAVWITQARAEEAARRRTMEEQEAAAAEQRRRDEEADEILRAAEAAERETAMREEMKKNKAKHMKIAVGVALPSDRPMNAPPAVMKRLKAGKYVPMWHFTDEGMKQGAKDITVEESTPLRVLEGGDGEGEVLLAAGSRSLVTKVKDDELTWEEFSVAGQRFIEAIRLAGWSSEHVAMFGRFYSAISLHKWRTEVDPMGIKRRALLIYAGAQRVLWHERLELDPETIEDLSVINLESLMWAKDDAYDRWRLRQEKERRNERNDDTPVRHNGKGAARDTRRSGKHGGEESGVERGRDRDRSRSPQRQSFRKESDKSRTSPGGVFGRTQARGVSPPASYVWDATNTRSSTAGASERGTGNMPPSSSGTMGSSESRRLEIQSASSGSWSRVVAAARTTIATFARAAARPLTELRRALAERTRNPASPYRVDEVERLLRRSGLEGRYPLVVDGLRHGFRVGFPVVRSTQVPPNKSSVDQYRDAFEAAVAKELDKGRYIGPASQADLEAILGHFQCSPLSIIPKAMVGKYRIIQNFSFPLSPSVDHPLPSVNSHTDASTFPCTWGTFASVAYLVWHLPPGSQMAVRDVAEAYRTIPLHRSQWSATVVGLGNGLFCADTFAAFGARPSGGVFGMVADAFVDLMRWRGMGPITKWVDDHIFFRIRRRYLDGFNGLRERWRLAVLRNGGEQRERGRIWFRGEGLVDGEPAELFEGCEFPVGVVEEERGGGGDEERGRGDA